MVMCSGIERFYDMTGRRFEYVLPSFQKISRRVITLTSKESQKICERRFGLDGFDIDNRSLLFVKATKPSQEEIALNPRARSAKLRAAIRTANPSLYHFVFERSDVN